MRKTFMKPGMKVLIKTVTLYYIGRVHKLSETEVALINASWIPSTGRWYEILQTGVLEEVEPYPSNLLCYVKLDPIISWSEWLHTLPEESK